jgi:hypothetical protein
MSRNATLYVKLYPVMIEKVKLETVRSKELRKVVAHGERITGYTTGISFYNHSVGLNNDDLKALIA